FDRGQHRRIGSIPSQILNDPIIHKSKRDNGRSVFPFRRPSFITGKYNFGRLIIHDRASGNRYLISDFIVSGFGKKNRSGGFFSDIAFQQSIGISFDNYPGSSGYISHKSSGARLFEWNYLVIEAGNLQTKTSDVG